MKYRKKPVVIDAIQFLNDRDGYKLIHWINSEQHSRGKPFARWVNDTLIIPTLEGDITAQSGDYIVQGEFYPCKPDIFELTYEVAE